MEGQRLEPAFGGLVLSAHPQTPSLAVPSVTFTYIWRGAGKWVFDFIVPVPPAALRLPAPSVPRRANDLWQHTCFELFLMDPDSGRYLEFNFSPSGQWAAYGFDGYRAGRRDLEVAAPRITTGDAVQFKLAMEAHSRALGLDEESIRLLCAEPPPFPQPPPQLFLSALLDDPELRNDGSWIASVSAVIEEADGTKSYWALAHPPGEPDFHHPDCFVLELPPAS